MSSEFYVVCNDKDIILEKNDDDNYRINISIIPSESNDFTLIDIIHENELWNLIYELNNDNIETFKLTNGSNNTNEDVFIKIKSSTEKNISSELKNIIIHQHCNYEFISNKECRITCNNLDESTIKFNDFKIQININNKTTEIKINFTLVDFNDLINTYIALYIKKIFYRLTKYLS